MTYCIVIDGEQLVMGGLGSEAEAYAAINLPHIQQFVRRREPKTSRQSTLEVITAEEHQHRIHYLRGVN